jgi:MFS family permease
MALLSSKSFVLFTVTLGVFIDTFAYSVVLPFFPYVIKELGGEEKDVGVVLSFFSIGLLIGSLLFGFISDRLGSRKLLMVLGLLMLILSTLIMIIIKEIWVLALGRFLQGLASGSIWVLGLALIADTHDTKEMGLKMGIIFSGYTMGNFAGPLCGGYLYKHLGYTAPFLSIIVLSIIDGITRILLKEKPIETKLSSSFITTMSMLSSSKPLLVILLLTVGAGLVLGGIEVNLTLVLQNRYLLSPDQVGLSFLIFIIPELIFGPIAGFVYDRKGFKIVLLPGMICTAIVMFLMGIELPLLPFFILLGLMACTFMFGMAPILPEMIYCAPESMFGACYGLFNFAFGIGLLVGPIVSSLLFQYGGWDIFCYSMGGFILMNVLIALLYQRPVKTDQPTIMELSTTALIQ